MTTLCKNTSTQLSLSIIPTNSKKIPFKGWKQYQTECSDLDNWHNHYLNQGYVGIITGAISGNLEAIDIDTKNDPTGIIAQEYIEAINAKYPSLINTLLIQKTVNNGFHFIYRCNEDTIEGSQKLALHTDGEVIIETRGEGGYLCTHRTDYKIIQGRFDLVNLEVDIPVITPSERTFLLDTARSLTRYFPTAGSKKGEDFRYKNEAINRFNEEFDILHILGNHGLTIINEDSDKYFLLRDGSKAAHSGYYFKNTKTFFCFSTSTAFEAGKPYNNFQIIQLLEANGDYKTALRKLEYYGFVSKSNGGNEKITSDDIATFINESGVVYDTFIQDLTINDQIIDQRTYNTLYLDMKKSFDKEVAKGKFDDVINSSYIQTYHPIEEFITQHKHLEPNGTFEDWFDCIELNNPNIDRNVAITYFTKWYVGIIAQALNGKFPNEFFLTLISTEQGIGKTSLQRYYLLPPALQQYVTEHPLDVSDDYKVMMGQSLLMIDDEMDGKSWNEMNTFKSILSTKDISLRRKYDRRVSYIKRRCSFVGSGNNLNVIKEFQNRRIIPLEIKSIDFKKLEQINLTEMFIEAYHLFESDFDYSFQKTDAPFLKHLYADYVQKSDLDLFVDDYIDIPLGKEGFFITNLDIINTINYNGSVNRKLNNVILGKMMAERGFQHVKKGSKRETCYLISENSKIIKSLHCSMNSWNYNPEFTCDEPSFIYS